MNTPKLLAALKLTPRHLFWLMFLGGAAVAAVVPELAPEEASEAAAEATVAAPVSRTSAAAESREEVSPADELIGPLIAKATATEAPLTADLFSPKTWLPPAPAPKTAPPPVAVVPRPAPPPTAPPLPFTFMGKLDDASRLRVFLARGDKAYTVAEGDVIDNTYRVVTINAGQMTLLYLPLNQPQSLSIGNNLK
jgi:hypothetical protein